MVTAMIINKTPKSLTSMSLVIMMYVQPGPGKVLTQGLNGFLNLPIKPAGVDVDVDVDDDDDA